MFARITRFAVSPDAVDQMVRAADRFVIPEFERMKGYSGGLIMVDRDRRELVGIGLWRELEDVEASAGALQAAYGTGSMFGDPLRVLSQETLEVVHRIPEPDSGPPEDAAPE